MLENFTLIGLFLAGLYVVARALIELFFRRKHELLRRLMNSGAQSLRRIPTGEKS